MNVVSQFAAPLYDGGYRLPRVRPRLTQSFAQPAYPLYDGWGLSGLGVNAPGIVAAAAPIAIKAGAVIATAAGAGAWAGPIGAGIGVLVGVLAGLWSAHNARVQGATHENQAINSAVQTWDAGMRAIFAAANSSDPTRNISGSQAAGQVQALWSEFWQQMTPYLHAPGVADSSGGGVNCGSATLNPAGACKGTPGGHKCDSSCTATCCVACQDLYPSMLEAIAVLNSPGGGTVEVCGVSGSGYGASSRGSYTLTFSPPNLSSATGASLASGLSSMFGGTGSSTGSLLPVLAIGALALLLY